MKKVLIVGENSYIGKSFEDYASDRFTIDVVDAREDKWKNTDFSVYDSVLHCAGIAHESQKKEMESLYQAVNCDLAVAVAKRAKESGVKQFVLLSSFSVYGSDSEVITVDSPTRPGCFYGASKLRAEEGIQALADHSLKVCIVRPPMVYGKGCKGNFPKLVRLAKIAPFFPKIDNRRSMIYIENLSSFLSEAIDDQTEGLYLPQNVSYVNTTELVRLIALMYGKKLPTTSVLNHLFSGAARFSPHLKKMFGNLTCDFKGDEESYNKIGFEESIAISIGSAKKLRNYVFVKRVMDLVAVVTLAPLWLPLMMILALIVKMTSPGPVLFSQKRYGKKLRFFMIYKFRTMYIHTPKDVPTHLLENPESYITSVGRFLRKSSLDELPQLFNILKGELSLVGPRPALWNQGDLIAEREKFGANDISVGLTGLAQVSGRDELPIETKARLDGEYAERMSFWLDIKILLQTVTGVITGRGVKEGGKHERPSESDY